MNIRPIPIWLKLVIGFMVLGIIGNIIDPKPATNSATAPAPSKPSKEKELAKSQDFIVATVHQMIESRLADPGSVDWLGTYVYENLDVCVDFSAKNKFGGRVKAYAAFVDGKFTMNYLKAWNSRCGDRGAVRYY